MKRFGDLHRSASQPASFTHRLFALTALSLGLSGCAGDLFSNQTAERVGNVSVIFINNTPFRASFSFGTWDSLDRVTPGPVTLQQARVAAGVTTDPTTLPCRRNFAIGSEEFNQRVIDTRADDTANFDPDAFTDGVNFSSAPADSDAAALPTRGKAQPIELLLGVDFSCGDIIIFTYVEDPDAPEGFRIDYEVIVDERDS